MVSTIRSQVTALPNCPGIYEFFDEKDTLLYVGKSVNIKSRVSSYFTAKNPGPKTKHLVSKISKIKFIKVFSEFEALMLESDLIRKNQPFYNIISRDDKSPMYIKIAGKTPLISLVRKSQIVKGDFSKGPLPSAKMGRIILKRIRRIFPYCQHRNHKKPCLYVHLGLCPYPYRDESSAQEYLKTVRHIKRLLTGKTKILLKELTFEMNFFSNRQMYERAAVIKRQIENLQFLTTTFHDPRDFLEEPNLVDDKLTEKLKSLQELLNLPGPPKRIECYDISNIQGKNATGSMVVFTSGQADKAQYRRFKIQFLESPNDYLMMKQVLTRRFGNEWPKPDLVVMDGGRGQLGIALKVLATLKLRITVIGLAKRYEEIHTPALHTPIRLPVDSPARRLLQEIRDEAHRFAITYHRKLRALKFLESVKS